MQDNTRLAALAALPAAAIATLVAFATDPVGFIVEVVAAFVVATLLELGAIVVGVVDTFATTLAAIPRVARLALSGAFGAAGDVFIGTVASAYASLLGVVSVAGPAAPLVVVGLLAGTVALTYRVGVALVGELPGGSSLVDILGLR